MRVAYVSLCCCAQFVWINVLFFSFYPFTCVLNDLPSQQLHGEDLMRDDVSVHHEYLEAGSVPRRVPFEHCRATEYNIIPLHPTPTHAHEGHTQNLSKIYFIIISEWTSIAGYRPPKYYYFVTPVLSCLPCVRIESQLRYGGPEKGLVTDGKWTSVVKRFTYAL